MADELRRRRPGFEAAVLATLTSLIVYLSRQYSQAPTTEGKALLRVGELIGELESRYALPWTLEELATRSCMSRSNLVRVFRQAVSHPPIDYLNSIRIQQAMTLLRETDEPIADIAATIGFPDSNYFAQKFRAQLQCSPRDYRRRTGSH